MKLHKVIKILAQGGVVASIKDKNKSIRYFLFGDEKGIFYIHDKIINEDKKELAVLKNQRPNLLSENWWKDDWEIYLDSSTPQKQSKEVIKKAFAILASVLMVGMTIGVSG